MKRILSSSAVMNNNASSSRLSILATLLLLSSRFYATSACGFYFSVGCEGSFPYTATNTLTLTLSGEAEVIYHWTEKNTYSGTVSLNGEETLDAVSFDYGKTGEYYVGATVIWGDRSGCEGTQGEDFSLISFTGNSCDVDDDAEPPQYLLENGMTYEPGVQDGGSNAPTSMESQFESTDPPSKLPTTPPPTVRKVTRTPTRRPTTFTPTLRPVFIPDTNTAAPSDKGTGNLFPSSSSNAPSSDSPTVNPPLQTTYSPTSPPFTDVIECGDKICDPSEDVIVCSLDCKSLELTSPDNSNDVAIISQTGVYFQMISERDIILTGMEIFPGNKEAGFENGVTVYARRGDVGYDTLMSNKENEIYSTNNALSGSAETGGTKIKVNLPMHEKVLTSVYIVAGSGGVECLTRIGEGNVDDDFLSIRGGEGVENDKTTQIQFKGSLRYDVVESLTPYPTMAPNADNTSGPTYTFSPTMVGGEIGGDGLNPDSVTVDKSESTNNSQTIIAAGATAGVCVAILTLAIGMFFVRKKKRENFQQSKTSTQDMTPDRVGLEIETQSETLYQQNQPQSYFGTIHKKEGEVDDISTLGDPYMGDAVNARMDADNTVGESMVSNQQQLYIYGVGKPGANVGTASRMGESTVFSGSKVMMFGDDTALEDIYQTPTPNGDSTLDLITVVAPAGPLGIVLDNPHGALPYVYAIKETSSLNGRVRVGDLLLSVDEVDCRGMSSHTITRFLGSRAANPERKLVLARGTGMDHDGSTASAV